jgi:hypothetical protein
LTACVEVVFKVTGQVEGEDVVDFFRDLGIDLSGHTVPDLECNILKGYELVERVENYAFSGEKVEWLVLVMDKNKIEQVIDVVATVGDSQDGGGGGHFEVIEDDITFCDAIPSTATDWNDMLILDKFDPSLGDLVSVDFVLDSNMTSDVAIEHTSTISPANITVDVDGSIVVLLPDGSNITLNISFEKQSFNSTIFDGLIDFGGTSGITFPTLESSDSVSQSFSNLVDFTEAFPGDILEINVSAVGSSQVIGSGNIASLISTMAESSACVTYTYNDTVFIPGSGGSDVEVECVRLNGYFPSGGKLLDSCNARILEEQLDQFDDQTMAFYECTFTVEPNMYGEHWLTVEACDSTDNCATMDENEFWFFNPVIALDIEGDLDFGVVRPGTLSYSETILIENDADPGSGVLLDTFVSGTDFYDPNSNGARCVITNRLKLGNNHPASGLDSAWNVCSIGFGDTDDHLCYYATAGAYSTQDDPRADAEGYVPIVYGDSFDTDFYNDAEIMQPLGPYNPGYQPGNILSPGAEIALTFKLGLPEPCVGDFSEGTIYFWGEAV